MVLSPGSRASCCVRRKSGPPPAGLAATAVVMPLTRHSMRPMPLPLSAMRASTSIRSWPDAPPSAGGRIATSGGGTAEQHLRQIGVGGRQLHLAARISRQMLAYEIRRIERLPHLIDAGRLVAAHDGQQIAGVGRCCEEALVGDHHPAAIGRRGEGRAQASRAAIPIADGPIVAARDDPAAVAREQQRVHIRLVPAQEKSQLAAGQVPDLDASLPAHVARGGRTLPGPRSHQLGIWRYGNAARADVTRYAFALEGPQYLPGLQAPHEDACVAAAAEQKPVVRRECERCRLIFGIVEPLDQPGRLDIPDLGSAILPAHRQALPVRRESRMTARLSSSIALPEAAFRSLNS